MAITSGNQTSIATNAIYALDKSIKESEEACKETSKKIEECKKTWEEMHNETKNTIDRCLKIITELDTKVKLYNTAFENEIDKITQAQANINKLAQDDLTKYKKDITQTISQLKHSLKQDFSFIHSAGKNILKFFSASIVIAFLIVIGFSFYPYFQNNKIKDLENQLKEEMENQNNHIKDLENQLKNLSAYIIFLYKGDRDKANKGFNLFLNQREKTREGN